MNSRACRGPDHVRAELVVAQKFVSPEAPASWVLPSRSCRATQTAQQQRHTAALGTSGTAEAAEACFR
eukprot:13943349-Alexandrium_andersonii.AAC.1